MKFHTRPDGFNAIRKKVIIVMVTISTGVIALVSGPALFSDDAESRGTAMIMIPFFIIVIGFTVWLTLKKQKQEYDSFTLTIDDGSVTRESFTLPPVTIKAADIVKIDLRKNGSVMITGTGRAYQIPIPPGMDNYEQMITMLTKLKPINKP